MKKTEAEKIKSVLLEVKTERLITERGFRKIVEFIDEITDKEK